MPLKTFKIPSLPPVHAYNRDNSIEIEQSRRIFLYYFFAFLTSAYMLVFGITSLIQGRYGLALFLVLLFAITMINIITLMRTRNIARASWFNVGIIGLAIMYLIITGGVGETGPLWSYPLLPFVIFIQGYRLGFFSALGLLAVIAFVLFGPLEFGVMPDYAEVFRLRFFASLIGVFLVSLAMEYLRQAAFEQLRTQGALLEEASRTDYLTGLTNRRHALEKLDVENNRHLRSKRPYCVMLIDIDDFKVINDQRGHAAGDCVLKQISRIFVEHVRQHDMVSRWGGEEFLILLPENTLEEGRQVAEKLRKQVEEHIFTCDSDPLRVTISIGVEASKAGHPPLYFINLADKKLYRAKAAGKNRVVSSTAAAEPEQNPPSQASLSGE